MGVKCFLLDPTEKIRRSLRRYVSSELEKCPGPGMSYHNASRVIDEQPVIRGVRAGREVTMNTYSPEEFAGDPRWPNKCDHCDRALTEDDKCQVFVEPIYRRTDTGEEMTLRGAPPGAMWDATWFSDIYRGPDRRCLVVRLPDGHDWMIDSRASNCSMRGDNSHKCWVRHGEPPNITVDKNGHTCQAGGGSIQTPKWHGFLRNGELVVA